MKYVKFIYFVCEWGSKKVITLTPNYYIALILLDKIAKDD